MMTTLITGLELALSHSLPIIIFGVVYRLGRQLDLSLDAQLALAGVVFSVLLAHLGSPIIAMGLAVIAVCLLTATRLALSEWGRVPVEVCSLLMAFATFKGLELWVGESVSLTGVTERLHVYLLTQLGIPQLAIALALAGTIVVVLEVGSRTHFGLMFRGLGSNPYLPVRYPRWVVVGLVVVGAGALVGFAGVVQADREGGVFSGFHLSRLVDAFVVAELTDSFARRMRVWAERTRGRQRRILIHMADSSIPVQVLIGALLLGTLSYALVRYLHPALPAMLEAIVVLLVLTRTEEFLRWSRVWRRDKSFSVGEDKPAVASISKSYRSYLRTVPVLDAVTLEGLPSTGLVVVYGENAAGKSTLLKILAGQLSPDAGVGVIGGLPIARACRLLSQDPATSLATTLTVRENLALAVGRAKKTAALARLSDEQALSLLSAFSESHALIAALDRPAASLSGGQMQILALACATVDGSRIILADEPVKMLDQSHRAMVERELLRLSRARLVLMSAHEPRTDLAPPERHYRLENGKVARGIAQTGGHPVAYAN